VGADRFWNRDAETGLFIPYLDEGASMYFVAALQLAQRAVNLCRQRRLDRLELVVGEGEEGF